MENHEQLSGIVEKIIFHNEQNGFAVFVVKQKKAAITVRGFISQLQPGQQVQLQGSWIKHPKFGKQFEAKEITQQLPQSVVGIKKYLGSGLIKGIGPKYAEKLVDFFGSTVLEVIDQQPDRLKLVPGIGQKRIEQIITAWQDQKEISNIMVFLQEKGVSTAYAVKIFKKYGHEARSVLLENPYKIADDIWGIGFKIADQIAQNLGIAKNSIKRVRAGILYVIAEHVGNGNLYMHLEKLKDKAGTLLELEAEESATLLKTALHDLYNSGRIKLISQDNEHFVTLSQYYFSEKNVAFKVKELQNTPIRFSFSIDKIYQQLRTQTDNSVQLNQDQQRAIVSCLQNKATIITGGPGTGKTTLIKQLLATLEEQNVSYLLAAPTGRAAKRMSEGTGKFAQTIHRLLEFDVSTFGFSKNEQNALKTDFLIIDEASMIDIFLALALLKSIPQHGHIIFIGDIDQLPSVGAGNFLSDMIESKQVPCIRLTEIFRQAQDSMIIINAHKINNGQPPILRSQSGKKDFFFFKEQEPTQLFAHLKEFFTHKMHWHKLKINDVMVLVPMNRGIVGVQQINDQLQDLINPAQENKPYLSFGGTQLRLGDRIMQIRNNYDKNVFNGDIGYITEVDTKEKVVTVSFDGKPIPYESSELDELVLAYAISIHKSQGSEFPCVIIPLFMQHFMLLQRNLIYTGLTRAKKVCLLIGQPKALAIGIKNNKSIERKTFLKEFLTSDLQCR